MQAKAALEAQLRQARGASGDMAKFKADYTRLAKIVKGLLTNTDLDPAVPIAAQIDKNLAAVDAVLRQTPPPPPTTQLPAAMEDGEGLHRLYPQNDEPQADETATGQDLGEQTAEAEAEAEADEDTAGEGTTGGEHTADETAQLNDGTGGALPSKRKAKLQTEDGS